MKYFVRMWTNVCHVKIVMFLEQFNQSILWNGFGFLLVMFKLMDVNKCHEHHMCKHDHMHQSQDNFCRGWKSAIMATKASFLTHQPGVPLHRSPWVVGDLCWKEMWSIAHNWYIECLMELGVGKVLVFWSFPSFFVLHVIFMYKIGISQLTKVGQNLWSMF
jgi:hypothetical protein